MTRRLAAAWIVALWLVSLAAAADDNAASRPSPPPSDAFAAYDALLNSTASRTLQQVRQPEPAATTAPDLHDAASVPSPAPDGNRARQRVEQLRPVIEPVLRQVGVPLELAAVVLIESGGDPAALSPKGALGLWQLMPDTARRYGLVVDSERDERLDALKSTRAAAEYLRDLYAQFHAWPLALAAFNAGEHAVQRAMARTGSSTFSLAAAALPRETQNYVPAVLAAFPRFGMRRLVETKPAVLRVVYAATGP